MKSLRGSSSAAAAAASSEMRFVYGTSSGDILSPITPVAPDAITSTMISSADGDLATSSDNHDYDSSDAISVKSVGQVMDDS